MPPPSIGAIAQSRDYSDHPSIAAPCWVYYFVHPDNPVYPAKNRRFHRLKSMELINQKKAGFGACKHRQRILAKPYHFCTVFWI
jgi:hypothetical protein